MASKVTDDPSPPQPDVASPRQSVPIRAGRPAAAARSTPLFEDDHPGVSRLYTVAMMADVLSVPRSAVRHWLRGGLIEPARRAGGIEWFEFPQLVIGRQLVRLLRGGLSLREIDAKLAELVPGGAAEAARMADRIVVDGRRLSMRCDDGLVGAGGQLQLGFYTAPFTAADTTIGQPATDAEPPFTHPHPSLAGDDRCVAIDFTADDPCDLATVGELLYRAGDLTAARERYYAAVELDANHLEARSSLGCVLAELGEHELALAALDGVLRQQPDYADAHWHIASVLHDVGRLAEARQHLRTFLRLTPDSPWATMARERLSAGDNERR